MTTVEYEHLENLLDKHVDPDDMDKSSPMRDTDRTPRSSDNFGEERHVGCQT